MPIWFKLWKPDMEVWQIVLYTVAVGLALRSLMGLMTARKLEILHELAFQEEQKRLEEAARVEAEKAAAKKAKSKKPAPAGA